MNFVVNFRIASKRILDVMNIGEILPKKITPNFSTDAVIEMQQVKKEEENEVIEDD